MMLSSIGFCVALKFTFAVLYDPRRDSDFQLWQQMVRNCKSFEKNKSDDSRAA